MALATLLEHRAERGALGAKDLDRRALGGREIRRMRTDSMGTGCSEAT